MATETEAPLPWQRCGRQHAGGQRAAVYTAALIQKVTLSQDDMRTEIQFVSRSKKHHLSASLRDCVFSGAFQDGLRRWLGSNPGNAWGRQWEKKQTISTCEFVLNLGPPEKKLPLCYFYPPKVMCVPGQYWENTLHFWNNKEGPINRL